jgi:hypothetical protein
MVFHCCWFCMWYIMLKLCNNQPVLYLNLLGTRSNCKSEDLEIYCVIWCCHQGFAIHCCSAHFQLSAFCLVNCNVNVKCIMLQVLHGASGMYRNLNSLAMQLTKRGGLLMTCSCSGAVTQSGIFPRILQVL